MSHPECCSTIPGRFTFGANPMPLSQRSVIPITFPAATLFAVKQFHENGVGLNATGPATKFPFVPAVALIVAVVLRPSSATDEGNTPSSFSHSKSTVSTPRHTSPFLKSHVRKCATKVTQASPRSMSLLRRRSRSTCSFPCQYPSMRLSTENICPSR